MVHLKHVRRDAPWAWLKAGWQDIIRAPRVTVGYGLIFVGAGALIVLGLNAIGFASAVPVALSGFALVAPALAIGIYQVPRAIERGEKPRFRFIIPIDKIVSLFSSLILLGGDNDLRLYPHV